MQKIVQIVILVFVIAVLFFLAMGVKGEEQVDVGDKGFNFQLEDTDGKIHTLADYEGKVVVLNFFTSWCDPCLEEASELEAFYEEYKDKVPLLIIDRAETKDRVIKFIDEYKSKLTYLLDYNMEVSKKYKVIGQPETIIIDKEGVIREHIIGGITKDILALKVSKYQ